VANATASKKAQSPAKGGRPAGLFTWIAVGVVLVIVVGLVVIKMTSGSPAAKASTTFEAVDATTLSQISSVPASVFNTVGVTSPVAPISGPSPLSGQPALTKTVNGKALPLIQYVGAEYCPYCAAERWTTVVALSRFGTFSNLGFAQSGATDVYPNTKTFTFRQASYTSPYVAFSGAETFTSIPNPATNFYFPLQKLTAAQTALVKKYDTMKYIPTSLRLKKTDRFRLLTWATSSCQLEQASPQPLSLGSLRDKLLQRSVTQRIQSHRQSSLLRMSNQQPSVF